jgi:hypothetical protein
MSAALERVGVMVIRIWTEGPGTELRARLTQTLDVSDPQDTTATVVGPEQVVDGVKRFVETFLATEAPTEATEAFEPDAADES